MLITIHPSPTADSRTCDPSVVSREQLLLSSRQHIKDVAQALGFFAAKLAEAAASHDYDKLTDLDGFYKDFRTNFATKDWWNRHRMLNRHHLDYEDGVPEDVNLIDVLEWIADCVMAGMARRGNVYPLTPSIELLNRAFQNTVDMLAESTHVQPQENRMRNCCPQCGSDMISEHDVIATCVNKECGFVIASG